MRLFQSHVPALPVRVDSHKEIACDFDWESLPASQEIRVEGQSTIGLPEARISAFFLLDEKPQFFIEF